MKTNAFELRSFLFSQSFVTSILSLFCSCLLFFLLSNHAFFFSFPYSNHFPFLPSILPLIPSYHRLTAFNNHISSHLYFLPFYPPINPIYPPHFLFSSIFSSLLPFFFNQLPSFLLHFLKLFISQRRRNVSPRLPPKFFF